MTTIYTGENVVIKGQITFGNDCSIWHNSVIRTENDPITIGDQTNIQDLVMIHTGFHQCPVSIGSNVTIGHSTICLLYTSPSPRDIQRSRMPSSA